MHDVQAVHAVVACHGMLWPPPLCRPACAACRPLLERLHVPPARPPCYVHPWQPLKFFPPSYHVSLHALCAPHPQVHITADGECVVFHDFLVPIRLGTEVVRLPIPTLTYEQLKSPDFTQWMVSPK